MIEKTLFDVEKGASEVLCKPNIFSLRLHVHFCVKDFLSWNMFCKIYSKFNFL